MSSPIEGTVVAVPFLYACFLSLQKLVEGKDREQCSEAVISDCHLEQLCLVVLVVEPLCSSRQAIALPKVPLVL